MWDNYKKAYEEREEIVLRSKTQRLLRKGWSKLGVSGELQSATTEMILEEFNKILSEGKHYSKKLKSGKSEFLQLKH